LSVRIRLRRMGAKKRPFYRFVVTDSRSPRDGRFSEILGYYDPIETPAKVAVEEERIYHWLKQGAVPTETVNSLFRQVGLISKWEKLSKGEDVSGIELLTQITERKKKKKTKKRVVKAEGPEVKEEEVKEAAQVEPEAEKSEEKEKEVQEKKEKEKQAAPEKSESKKETKKEVKPESEGKKSEKKEAESKTKDSEEGKS
jgi:small subunit ribosomal protein S16